MSSLAKLLNPAPSSTSSASAHTTYDGDARQHNRNVSLTSPLEALAIAATTSPPVLSPTHPLTAPIIPSSTNQQTYPNSSSRADSSHISLPVPHALAHPSPSFSPTFDLHSPNNNQMSSKKLLGHPNGATTQLPPLRSSLSDDLETAATIAPQLGSLTETQNQKVNTSEHLPSFHHIHDTQTDLAPLPTTSLSKMNAPDGIDHYTDPGEQVIKPEALERNETFAHVDNDTRASKKHLTGLSDGVTTRPDTSSVAAVAGMKREDSTSGFLAEVAAAIPEDGHLNILQSIASKKRPVTKEKKIEKKGIASAIKKPTAKKRKLDQDSMDGTPNSQRSGTPASSRASKTPAPRNRKQDSATPMQSSPAPMSKDADTNEDDDVDDDSELFCICRKPDDHTWMIGCDGGCEDWFHGRCVNMNERDGNLIDKYICMWTSSVSGSVKIDCIRSQL